MRELRQLVANLLSYEHDLAYTGSLPLKEVTETLLQRYPPLAAALQRSPPFRGPWRYAVRKGPRSCFSTRRWPQALVRIESGGDSYGEIRRPQIDLFNEYFYGGMAGIVFQELREARALAYSTWAWLFPGSRRRISTCSPPSSAVRRTRPPRRSGPSSS